MRVLSCMRAPVAFAAILVLASCGKGNFDNGFDRPEGQAVVDSGADWSSPAPTPTPAPCPSSSPTPIPSPTPSPSVSPSPVPPPHPVSGWCRTFPWWPGCEARISGIGGECDPGEPKPKPTHNTRYCQVDASGAPISADQIFSRQEGDAVHNGGGGCIQRPIQEVWGTFFNDPLMKPDDVDVYVATAQPGLIDSSQRVVFAFDLYNKKSVPLINPDWVVRWFHAVPYGDWTTPNQVAINFQKISGTGYIKLLRGGYVLDRVTDSVTSFVMDQQVDASQYDTDKGYHDVARAMERARTGRPMLPARPQSDVPPRTIQGESVENQ